MPLDSSPSSSLSFVPAIPIVESPSSAAPVDPPITPLPDVFDKAWDERLNLIHGTNHYLEQVVAFETKLAASTINGVDPRAVAQKFPGLIVGDGLKILSFLTKIQQFIRDNPDDYAAIQRFVLHRGA